MTADVVIEEIVDNPLKWPRAFFLGALGASDFPAVGARQGF